MSTLTSYPTLPKVGFKEGVFAADSLSSGELKVCGDKVVDYVGQRHLGWTQATYFPAETPWIYSTHKSKGSSTTTTFNSNGNLDFTSTGADSGSALYVGEEPVLCGVLSKIRGLNLGKKHQDAVKTHFTGKLADDEIEAILKKMESPLSIYDLWTPVFPYIDWIQHNLE